MMDYVNLHALLLALHAEMPVVYSTNSGMGVFVCV